MTTLYNGSENTVNPTNTPQLNKKTRRGRVATQALQSPFGRVLDQIMVENGFSQSDLSDASNDTLAQSQISNYRIGRRFPKRETITLIAKALVSRIDSRSEAQSACKIIETRLLEAAGFLPETALNDDTALLVHRYHRMSAKEEVENRWRNRKPGVYPESFDVDECESCGFISSEHFAAFMEFVRTMPQRS